MKNFWRILGGMIILLVLLAVSASVWLKTNGAREKVQQLVVEAIKEQTGFRASIEGMNLSFPLIADIERVSLSKGGEEILRIKGFHINILPSLFSLWEISVWSVSAKELHFLKKVGAGGFVPEEKGSGDIGGASEKLGQGSGTGFFAPDIMVRKVEAENIILAPQFTGIEKEVVLSLGGSLSFDMGAKELEFVASSSVTLLAGEALDENLVTIIGSYNVGAGDVRIKLFEVVSGYIDARGEFELRVREERVLGEMKYSTSRLGGVLSEYIEGTKSAISGIVKISGSPDNARVSAQGNVLIDFGENEYVRLSEIDWKSEMLFSKGAMDGSLTMNQGAVHVNGGIAYKDNKFYVKNMKAVAPGAEEVINLVFNFENSILTGDVRSEDRYLLESAKYFPFLKSGSLALKTVFYDNNNRQGASVKGQIKQLSTKFGDCGLINLDLNSSDLWNGQIADSNVSLKFLEVGTLMVQSLKLRASSGGQGGVLASSSGGNHIRLSGEIGCEHGCFVDLKFASRVSAPAGAGWSVAIDEISGMVGDAQVKNSGVILLGGGKGSAFEINDLKIGRGTFNASGKISDRGKASAGGVSGLVVMSDVPMNALSEILPEGYQDAKANGRIELSGSGDAPVLKGRINIDGLLLPGLEKDAKPGKGVGLRIVANLTSDRTILSGRVLRLEEGSSSGGGSKILSSKTFSSKAPSSKFLSSKAPSAGEEIARLKIDLPAKFTMVPFEYSIDDKKNFNASLFSKNFDIMALVPAYPGHEMEGDINADIVATGTLSNPSFKGGAELLRGEYRYRQHGVWLGGVSGKLAFNGGQVLVGKMSARDESGNMIAASGELSLMGAHKFKVEINTEKIKLISNAYLHGEMSGRLVLSGDKEQASAVGEFSLDSMEIKIPEHFTQHISEINIIEPETEIDAIRAKVQGERGKGRGVEPEKDDSYKLKLDIKVKADKRLYIRGWGVDALLRGGLHITGFAHDPAAYGRVRVVRGKYQEFGKILDIKNGELTFDGSIPPSPYLNIVGISEIGSHEIRLRLSGSILNPDISIESTPAMSGEEALSMLLFGEKAENISTFQALQLADSLRRLAGHGGGFDPLGLGRKILGVDDISFKTDANDPKKTSVGVGKYLTDRVYFEIEKGRQESGTRTKIEVQISPKISIKSVQEEEGNNSVGVNWRFDY
ncbi:MAG: hypothetical protein COA94_02200 [Rickettsiales bacterium]|nr:MAG: hypothetical protein COA94_02200 [Rickettsiales bacterium]